MHPILLKSTQPQAGDHSILLYSGSLQNLPEFLTPSEQAYLREQYLEGEGLSVYYNRLKQQVFVHIPKDEDGVKCHEALRNEGDKLAARLDELKVTTVNVHVAGLDEAAIKAFCEGMVLGTYRFIKYKSDVEKARGALQQIQLIDDPFTDSGLAELNALLKSVCFARDLVNEPHLTAETFAEEVCRLCAGQGVKTEVFNRSRIEALKMNGLLAVNQGSFYDPCFVVLEYKPENARNSKPLVLVGKGVIFDTGGMNLKPGNYMETMKSDMSGAAAVAGALLAVAAAKLPVHVVGLIPATDNRPGPKALVPGDIIRMNNGTTIEVINTDAEGRLILADALLYAKRYDPEVVIDIATLTGAAEMALGKHGMVAMHLNAAGYLEQLKQSGWNTYERLAEFPFWDEYDKEIESDVADIRNLGKAGKAGAITAGKFLSRFVSYPWIHLDIAGVAFNEGKESYRNKGGTGVGVRLFFDFLKNDGQL